jgi:hypothetical protein
MEQVAERIVRPVPAPPPPSTALADLVLATPPSPGDDDGPPIPPAVPVTRGPGATAAGHGANADPLIAGAEAPAHTVVVDTTGDLARPSPQKAKEPKAHHRLRLVVFVVAALAAMAGAAGVVWAISNWQEDQVDEQVNDADVTTTTIASSTTSTQPAPTTSAYVTGSATLRFEASCPAAGAGWNLVPVWPGAAASVAFYEYAVQDPVNGTWHILGFMTSEDPGDIAITGLAADDERVARVTAARDDGTPGVARTVHVTAPSTAC